MNTKLVGIVALVVLIVVVAIVFLNAAPAPTMQTGVREDGKAPVRYVDPRGGGDYQKADPNRTYGYTSPK